MSNQRSLSVLYHDPEAIPVPEPEPEADLPKRRGRPPGSKNKVAPVRVIPWAAYLRALSWLAVVCVSLVFLYSGVRGWLGESVADIVMAVAVVAGAILLDRDWKKMRVGG